MFVGGGAGAGVGGFEKNLNRNDDVEERLQPDTLTTKGVRRQE